MDARSCLRSTLLLLLLPASTACAGRSPAAAPNSTVAAQAEASGSNAGRPADAEPQLSPDGLVQFPAPGLDGLLFVRSPEPRLQRFREVAVFPPEVGYHRGIRPFERTIEDDLRSFFTRRMREALASTSGWKVTWQAGPDVLLARLAILDLAVQTDVNSRTSALTRIGSSAPCTLVLELRDPGTGETLLRFLQRRRLPPGTYSGADVDVERLRREIDRFASDSAESLRSYQAAVAESGAAAPAEAEPR